MQSLGFVRCGDFYRVSGNPQGFTDKDGARFSAKPDWWHPALNLYVETKSSDLNSRTTVHTAAKAESRQRQSCALRGKPFGTYDMLQTQWSHSRYKQAAVQSALTPQSMVVVFAEPVPYDLMLKYAKAGLVAIHLDALPQYIRYVQLTRYGLPVQWNLPYPEHSATFTL